MLLPGAARSTQAAMSLKYDRWSDPVVELTLMTVERQAGNEVALTYPSLPAA